MLKRLNFCYDDNFSGYVLIGGAKEIARTYKKMCEKCEGLYPLFLDEPPKLNPKRIYGIEVSEVNGDFCVVNAEWVICHLLNELEKTN